MLLDPFSEDEQKVVLAHELAHHSQRHLPEGLGWFALFAIPGAWILMRTTRRRGGMGAPAAVPLALLVVAIFQLATAPLANHISRRLEAEADWKALQVTKDPAALEGLMLGFSTTGARRPRPARLGAAHGRDAPRARRSHRDGARVRRATADRFGRGPGPDPGPDPSRVRAETGPARRLVARRRRGSGRIGT